MARRKRINGKKRHPSAYKHITSSGRQLVAKETSEQSLTESTKRKIHPTMVKGKDALQLF